MYWRIALALLLVALIALLFPQTQAPDQPFEDFATQRALPTATPTPDLAAEFDSLLKTAASDPGAALDGLDALSFSESPFARSGRELAQAIRRARVQGDEAYTYTAVGQYLGSLGEWEYAVEALQLAVAANPDFAEGWAYLGESRQHIGEDGLPALRTALDLNPLSLAANLFQALYWQRQGDYGEAKRYLQVAALIEPDNVNVVLQLAHASVAAGDIPEARQYFERATELAPDSLSAWTAAAAYSVEHDLFVEELGRPAANRALQLAPRDPGILVLVGRVEFLLGNAQDAKTFYERSLELDAGFLPAMLQLGICYSFEGEIVVAQSYFQQIVDLAPGSPEAQAAKQFLNSQ